MRAKSLQSCLTLSDPMDCRLSGFFVQGVLQEGILEWVAIVSTGDLPNPGIEPVSLTFPALAGGSLPQAPPGKPQHRVPKRVKGLRLNCSVEQIVNSHENQVKDLKLMLYQSWKS